MDYILIGKRKRILKRISWFAARITLGFLLVSMVSVLLLKFIPPVTSAFMVAKICKGGLSHGKQIRYHWVSWKNISPSMALAVVAAEDQKFPVHFGFDFGAIADALEEGEKGRRLRGASTISQQVAKNLFLWEGRSFLRKGVEAYFTVLMEALWSKRRILEIYLNIAEFGDGIYGVKAAAQNVFAKPPSELTMRESALLAAVLPSPITLKAAAPSAYVKGRAHRIEKQMRNLGPSHLNEIWIDP
ncbi:MAG: monofunctional biosynthetic peptidoglycan transglycosylase [Proteobacteria bacterium]|nr:monofunctional biosynthetic peptidoglycan transglycosylase [Pseudomonadota bacterium]MBU4470090.1 monofunctional biosynthetic peptidoglycan transglycosylase [Pseudomonadota bacterium]MCG2750735.1 monofunctional biosynthetic peptidoglycan transglycosylase [Desulfobacteraceae bacterium]